MFILSWLFFIFNLLFAVVSFVPCVMGGAMGMDSPQAQKDPVAVIMSLLFLSFPVLCVLCGILPPVLQHFKFTYFSVIVGLWPCIQAVGMFLFLLIYGE